MTRWSVSEAQAQGDGVKQTKLEDWLCLGLLELYRFAVATLHPWTASPKDVIEEIWGHPFQPTLPSLLVMLGLWDKPCDNMRSIADPFTSFALAQADLPDSSWGSPSIHWTADGKTQVSSFCLNTCFRKCKRSTKMLVRTWCKYDYVSIIISYEQKKKHTKTKNAVTRNSSANRGRPPWGCGLCREATRTALRSGLRGLRIAISGNLWKCLSGNLVFLSFSQCRRVCCFMLSSLSVS